MDKRLSRQIAISRQTASKPSESRGVNPGTSRALPPPVAITARNRVYAAAAEATEDAMSTRVNSQSKRNEPCGYPAECGANLRGHLDARLPSFDGARPGP